MLMRLMSQKFLEKYRQHSSKTKIEVMMATVKELYDYIKLQIKLGKPINPFHQAIVDANEKDEVKIIKKINVSYVKNR